ncbi:unnamed protein product [Mucor hiemalis]
MATIYHRYERGDSTFNCPQKKEITKESIAPVARRLSDSFERYALNERRRSSVISEKNSIVDNIHSLKTGKLPTNTQLIKIINGLLYSPTIEFNKKFMSVDGQILLQDFQKLVVALQNALQTKNRDELFQSMIYHVRQSELSLGDIKPNNTDQLKTEVKSGARAAYKISKLLLFNSKFRALLMDMLSIAQQTLETQKELTENETSDNATAFNENKASHYDISHSNLTEGNIKYDVDPSISLAPLNDTGSRSSSSVHKKVQVHATDNPSSLDYPSSRTVGGVDASTNTDPLPKSSDFNHSTEQDKGTSSKEIVARLKEVFTTMQQNPQYQKAISTLFSLFKMWSQRVTDTSGERRGSMGDDNYASTAAKEAKTIIEDWAQGKSLDPIIERAYDLSFKIKQDPELAQLYEKVINFVQHLLKDPNYLESDDSTEEGHELVDDLRTSGFEKYKPEIDSMLQESSAIVTAITEDPITKEISEKVKSIHTHLWYDSNGNAVFKPQLLNDIRITLIPAIIEQIKYVPLPQVVYSDKKDEIAIENMLLSGDTLMPETCEVRVDDYLKFSPNKDLEYNNSQGMYVSMTGIQTVLEDVVFYYKRKSGFPKLSDAGVVSIHVSNKEY